MTNLLTRSGRLHVLARLEFELRRILRHGPRHFLTRVPQRFLGAAMWLALSPMAIGMHLAGFRRVAVFTDRIGHLAVEPDCLLKECALGLIPARRWFILAPPNRVANDHLLAYWKPLIRVYEGRLVCYVLKHMSSFLWMRQGIEHYILGFDVTHAAYAINAQWNGRSPLLTLTEDDAAWAIDALARLGLPKGAWFAAVHVREPGFSPIDEEIHSHRNGSIEAAIPAILEIVRRGGWVVRLGDGSMTPLPKLPQVIDYALDPMKSARLDVILCATAKFMLGNTSGVALVASVFGVPCALANMIPLSTLGLCRHDLTIPKLLYLRKEERYLRFDEVMNSAIANYRFASLYERAGIRVEENSSDEIRDLVVEMIERLEGNFVQSDLDRLLQAEYRSLFRRGHHSFGAISNVGASFLRKRRDLLPVKASGQITRSQSAAA